ncbi:MAG: tripartite tricarboxylate transporter substrate binding protein [Fusobacteriaceae bacterium]|jgi:tripartite-type tricarboxylate transporter receptor subunit TctC|nr:tripartite tricarboxylate transporter substrate binding protein [Fusobacteriaceae bacterium]
MKKLQKLFVGLFLALCFGMTICAAAGKIEGIVTIICPVAPGGDTDRNARVLAQYLQKYLGTTVIVKNVNGGATVMGMQECLDAKPDGLTLVVNGTDIFVPYMQGSSKINIDSFKTVAIPVIDNTTVLVVNKNSGWKTLKDYLAASQAKPGTIEYGGKIGAANQICGIAMNREWNAGLKFIDVGNNAAKVTALLGEQTDSINLSYSLAKDYFETGEFIALCLLGNEKNTLLPNVPLASDYGLKNVDFSKFFWVGTGPEVPDAVVDILAEAIGKVTKDQGFIDNMAENFLTVVFYPKEEGKKFANQVYKEGLAPYKEEFIKNQ